MKFTATSISGAWIIEPEPRGDERGFLVRTYCAEEFANQGLCTTWVQTSTVFNPLTRTLRGMHYQKAPHGEIKQVRCTQGAIYDVIVDLRAESPSFRQWLSVELSAENRKTLYIPEGVAHGLLTLKPGSEVFYCMSAPYHAEAAAGVRWNDPAFGIQWPAEPGETFHMAPRDASYPDFPC